MKKIVLLFLMIIQFIKADDYIVLVDLSDDVVGKIKGEYYKAFKVKSNEFNYGDKIYLYAISANSQVPKAAAIVKIDSYDKGMSKKRNEKAKEEALEEIHDEFRRLLRTTEQETRILDALKNAERVFNRNKTPKENRKILLFCDMVEYSSIHKHYFKKKILDINSIDIPRLDAEVTLFGLGYNLKTNLQSAQIDKIQEFWKNYFVKSNSSMIHGEL